MMDSDTLFGVVIPLGLTLTTFGLTLAPVWMVVFGTIVLMLWLLPPPGLENCLRRRIDFFSQHPQSQSLRKEEFKRIRAGGNLYKVHEDLDQPVLAAETLDRLNTVAGKLIQFLEGRYIKNPAGLNAIAPQHRETVKSGVIALRKNFRTASLEENIPARSGGDTSYVIDKGTTFAMCLRDPAKNNQVDSDGNTLVFVLLHELTHLFTATYGHDQTFWNNFGFVLGEAVEAGLYEPVDYARRMTPYCGIKVSYSPFYDRSLPSYKAAAS